MAILSPNPTQFGAPLYKSLSETGRYDIEVYFTKTADTLSLVDPELGHPPGWDSPLLDGYSYRVVHGGGIQRPIRVATLIARGGYDAIIVAGWKDSASRTSILIGNFLKRPLAVHSDVVSLYQRPYWKSAVRSLVLEPVLRRTAAFLATGSLARAHLLEIGIQAQRIFRLPYAVDNQALANSSQAFEQQRGFYRQLLGIPPSAEVFLAVAKFVEREGVLDLLRAYSSLAGDQSAWLLLVGDGPQYGELKEFAEKAALHRLVFAGYQPYSLLPKFYAVSDAFVIPAHRESWGVSVNEAMACGVPVIASDLVGAAHDLVHEDRTGFLFEGGNVDDLKAAMMRFLVLSPERRCAMREAARREVASWDYDSVASELDRLIQFLDARQECRK